MRVEEDTQIPGQRELSVSGHETTVLAGPVKCAVCETENPAGAEWCEECGFFLSGEPEVVAAREAFAKLVDPATGAEYPLKEGENTIGRGAGEVVLAGDAFVSRSHARIVVEPPNIFLEDLGSTNGTFLNANKVEPGQRVQIGPGDQVRFASTTLEVVAAEAAVVERGEVREAVGILEIESGAETRQHFKIVPGENSLGRHPSNDIPLGFDGYISGRHAKITASEEGIFLEDLGSSNGTEINGRRLTAGVKELLADGDEIRMGKTGLKFRAEERGMRGGGAAAEGSKDEGE